MAKECGKCLLREDQDVSTQEISLIARYLPYRIVVQIGNPECCVFENKIENFYGSVAYLDIVGFTHIVSTYVNSKKDVAELSDIFSSYYSVIIETVREFNGSVFQFAGDSILICFDQPENETKEQNWRRSMAAMARIFELSTNYNSILERANGFALQPKIGMSYGKITQLMLGDENHYITPVLTGSTVKQAVACEKFCSSQEFIVSANAAECIELCGMSDWFEKKESVFKLISVPEGFVDSVERPDYIFVESLYDNPKYYNRIHAFINPLILEQVKNAYEGFNGDYRDATCVMVRFDGDFTKTGNDETIKDGFDDFNYVYMMLQDVANKYDGFCNKPDLSDKGLCFPILFGVPTVLEEKEKTAVLFAAELLQKAKSIKALTAVNVGIASGTVYSGEFGASMRKDFTLIGNIINFAARMMMYNLSEKYSFYMEELTYSKVSSFFEVQPLESISLKGFTEKKKIFKYLGKKKNQTKKNVSNVLIGRNEQLEKLMQLYAQASSGKMSFAPVIGDAGMGKSFLVNKFISGLASQKQPPLVFESLCYQYEESTPFFCWRSIVSDLLGISENERTPELYRQKIAELVPEEKNWINLFLLMMGVDYSDDDTMKDIDPAVKQTHLYTILSAIIMKKATAEKPLVIVIDDFQWCDTISFLMLSNLLSISEPSYALFVLISRESDRLSCLFDSNSIPVIELQPLDDSEAYDLTETLVKTDEDATSLIIKIVTASEGNPFFIESIVHNLIKNGILVKQNNNVYHLTQDVDSVELPSSIHNLILSRLNDLDFDGKIICKTASVIGRTFERSVLEQLLPDDMPEETLTETLQNLEEGNLIICEDKEAQKYSFKNFTIRDVVYDTILESTKRELNLAMFSYLENIDAENRTSRIEHLLYYGLEAKAYDKIYEYAIFAAKNADSQGLWKEAAVNYSAAIEALASAGEDFGDSIHGIRIDLANSYRKNADYESAIENFMIVAKEAKSDLRKAEALQGVAKCYIQKGMFDKAIEELENAVKFVDKKVPDTKFKLKLSVLEQMVLFFINYKIRKRNVKAYTGVMLSKAELYTDILNSLNRLYSSDNYEKVVWGSLSNYNNILHIPQSGRYASVIGDCAVMLITSGFIKLGQKLFDSVPSDSDSMSDSTDANVFRAKYAFSFLLFDKLYNAIVQLENASEKFKNAGENWELMNAQSSLAQDYLVINQLEKAEKAFLEVQKLAEKLNSKMHIGKAYSGMAFCRFIRGLLSAQDAERMLCESVAVCGEVKDYMTLCVNYGYLSYISVKDANPKRAFEYAKHVLSANKLYRIPVPYVKESLGYAVEAFLFAAGSQELSRTDRKRAEKLAAKTCKDVMKIKSESSLINAVGLKSASLLAVYRGKKDDALLLARELVDVLKNSPYELEFVRSVAFAVSLGAKNADNLKDLALKIISDRGLNRALFFVD